MFYKTIGILGGMGAAATTVLFSRLVSLSQQQYGAKEDQDFPKVIVMNLPLAYIDSGGHSEGNDERWLDEIERALQTLEKAGAELIAINCNTIHAHWQRLQASVSVPLINLIQEVTDVAVSMSSQSIGILASEETVDTKLYENALRTHGIRVVAPTPIEQQMITDTIAAVMAGRVRKTHHESVGRIVTRMRQAGADTVIFGCTELGALYASLVNSHPIIDSVEVVAERLLTLARKEQL